MNKQQNEREARIERATKFLDLQSYGSLVPETRRLWTAWLIGFAEQEIELAGAASVDRVEIVREAFADFEVEVNDGRWKSGWRSTEEIKRAMNAIIAAMEKGK